MIFEDVADDTASVLGLGRTRVSTLHQGDKSFPRRPTPRTLPGRVVKPNCRTEMYPARVIEECPDDDKIA